jgi:hypothetical protein
MLVFVYWRLRTQIRCAATVRNCPMGALVSGAIVMELNKRYSTYCILGSVLFCIFYARTEFPAQTEIGKTRCPDQTSSLL